MTWPLLVALVACTPTPPTSAVDESEAVAAPRPHPKTPPADGELHVGAVEVVDEHAPIRIERQPWRLDGEVGVAYRVRLPRGAALEVPHADAVTPFARLLPEDAGPWVAVNGGFYDGEQHPMGLVVDHGQVAHKLSKSGSGVLEQGPHAMRIVHRDRWKPGAKAALQSIDRLVEGGKPLVNEQAAARHTARSAIALTEDAVWVVVAFADDSVTEVDDGLALHATSFRGLPLWAFARYLVDAVDADQALNLDGAISTQLAVRAGDFRWSVHGEAGTVQAVVVRP